jgi:Tol biopolymer transport system component
VLVAGLAGLCWLALLSLSFAQRADAAYPGVNGRIAFDNREGSTSQIWTVNPDGSAPAKLTTGPQDYSPAFSADGKRIAFSREEGIAVINADGSGLTNLIAGSSTTGSETIWKANYEDPETSQVVPEVEIEKRLFKGHEFGEPAFSPDGTQIAVTESKYDGAIEVICAVENEGDQECIESPDPDAYFNFQLTCSGCYEHIVTISSTTGALTGALTPATAEVEDYDPAYSVNGKLAFNRYDNTSESNSGLFVINAPGSAPIRLTSGEEDYAADFSPDGTRILFHHTDKYLAAMSVTGGPMTLISLPPGPPNANVDTGPGWYSPDGSQIAFPQYVTSPETPEVRSVFLIGADGSSPHPITAGSEPSWQPLPIPPPPPAPVVKSTAKGKKGKVRLDKEHEATIGTVTCGSAACALEVASAKLKAGKAKCGTKVRAPKSLAAGAKAKLKVAVKGKCLGRLEKAGKGVLSVKISVTSTGGTESLIFKVTLAPGEKKHKALR